VKDRQGVTRVIFVTGKHFYVLDSERRTRGVNNMAIIRLEVTYLRPVYCRFHSVSVLRSFTALISLVC